MKNIILGNAEICLLISIVAFALGMVSFIKSDYQLMTISFIVCAITLIVFIIMWIISYKNKKKD